MDPEMVSAQKVEEVVSLWIETGYKPAGLYYNLSEDQRAEAIQEYRSRTHGVSPEVKAWIEEEREAGHVR